MTMSNQKIYYHFFLLIIIVGVVFVILFVPRNEKISPVENQENDQLTEKRIGIIEQAISLSNPQICEQLEGYYYDTGDYIIPPGDSTKVYITKQQTINSCYIMYAVTKSDPSACNFVKNTEPSPVIRGITTKEECISFFSK